MLAQWGRAVGGGEVPPWATSSSISHAATQLHHCRRPFGLSEARGIGLMSLQKKLG